MTTQNAVYPVRLDVDYPPRMSRLLLFFRGLLALPHYLVLTILAIGAFVVLIVSWFATIITGRYPKGMHTYMAGYLRYQTRLNAYLLLLTDKYPPFSPSDDAGYPVRLAVDYPPKVARWRPLFNGLIALPAVIGLYIVMIIAFLATVLAWFAILITGHNPRGLFSATAAGLRWQARVLAFVYWMEEDYPPLSWA